MIAERVFGVGERDFRWRGGAVARVEGLSDSVFALALTLIVVSLDVPKNYGELIEVFVQVPVFAVCFALLVMLWFFQYRFHRRFGLEDAPTLLLNALLLFLVLLYVYPLRFMASFLYNALVLRRDAFLSWEQARTLMIVYSTGVALIYGVFAALYAHAYGKRYVMELDSTERVIARGEMHGHVLSAGVGVASVAIAACDERWVPYAGWAYFAMGPLHGLHGRLVRRALERHRGKTPTRSANDLPVQ